jgi:translation initiation factor 1
MEKKGRGEKTVTVVFGLPKNAAFLADLAKELKRACGSGGTVCDDGVELQGDVRDRVRALLERKQMVVKG